jgi:PhnB protein
MKTTPYLLFDGNCREAMEFYHGIFGGELSVTTVGESPMHDGFPVAEHSKVLNARLRSSALDISASDWLEPTRRPVPGNTVRLFVVDGTMSEAGAIFDKLSRDAEILEEFRERPFGAYGVLLDRFGIRWMFHSDRIDQPGSSQGAAPGHDMRK